MPILTTLSGRRVRVTIIAVVLAWSLISLSAERAHAVDPGTVITALKTAYSLFQAGKSLFDHSPSLQSLLDNAVQTVIEEIRDQELQDLLQSLQERYKEISRHKGDSLTELRLANFLDDSSDVFYRLEGAITESHQGNAASAYELLPAFNVITVLRAGALKEQWPKDKASQDAVFMEALEVNHEVVGAQHMFNAHPSWFNPCRWIKPLCHFSTIGSSILWKSSRYTNYWFDGCFVSVEGVPFLSYGNMYQDICYSQPVWQIGWISPCAPAVKAECFARETERTMPKYNADAVVQIGREAMRQIMALGYTALGRYIIIEP